MASSASDKRDSDVVMSEANQAPPAQDGPVFMQTFVEGFSSFQEKMERRRAAMESSMVGPGTSSVATLGTSTLGSDVALTSDPVILAPEPDVTPVPTSTILSPETDVPLPAKEGADVEPTPDSQACPEGFSSAPIAISDDVVEIIPPPSEKKKEIVLGLPASNAIPSSKGRSRAGTAGSAKRKRCTRNEEGGVSTKLSQHRSKVFRKTLLLFVDSPILNFFAYDQFVSLIDGMLGDCGLEVTRLSKELDSAREALKRTEATLESIESTHASQTSVLENRISDLERDLGKTVSSLLKAKEEKKSKSSEVRRLKKRIQRFEETRSCTAMEPAGPSSLSALVPRSEVPEIEDDGTTVDKGGDEVGAGDGEGVPASGESEYEDGVPGDA